MPGTVLRAGDPPVNKIGEVPALKALRANREIDHTQINNN